jgi:Putative zinc-finger
MILAHLRLRRLVSLLAAEALSGAERARVQAHVEACGRCQSEYHETRAFLSRVHEDPLCAAVRGAEVPVPLAVLRERVDRGIDRALASPKGRRPRPWLIGMAVLATALALGIAVPVLLERTTPPAPEALALTPEVSADALARLERNVAREQAASYLSEAQDVLATVASSPRDCERGERRVDVEAESRRSRELLARRALLLDIHEGAVAGAQPVLDDVEQILREVASMEACARFRDVERLQGEIERRKLLMKVRLMQRELLG